MKKSFQHLTIRSLTLTVARIKIVYYIYFIPVFVYLWGEYQDVKEESKTTQKHRKSEDLNWHPSTHIGSVETYLKNLTKYRESKERHNAEKTVTQHEKMLQVCPQVCYMNSARYPVAVPRYSKSKKSSWTDAASSGSNWNQPSPLSAGVEFTELCRCGILKTHNIIVLIFASVIRVLLVSTSVIRAAVHSGQQASEKQISHPLRILRPWRLKVHDWRTYSVRDRSHSPVHLPGNTAFRNAWTSIWTWQCVRDLGEIMLQSSWYRSRGIR